MTTEKLMLVQAKGVVYALILGSIEKISIPSKQQIKEIEGKKSFVGIQTMMRLWFASINFQS